MSDYSSTYPTQSPTFAFDAKAGKLDSRLSYSRSSGGTFMSSEKALSSENLLLDSKTGTANWTGDYGGSGLGPTITANHAASPDGTANQATRLQLDLSGNTGGGDYSRYSQSYNVASGTSATFAVYMKSNDGSSSYAAQIISPDGSGVAVTITGTWQKFTVTANSYGNVAYGVRLRGGQSPTNADTADILIWGANLSTTGQTVLNETTTQIHREYAPLLKTASADSPRFEYAADGQSVGLLIEAQATSLITYSEDFSNAFWDKTRLSIDSNVSVAPDGALTASALRVDGTAASTHRMRFTYATGGATAQTFSIFAKAGSKSWLALKFDSSGGAFDASIAYFNLASGTTGTVDSGVTAKISECGNGWHRCSITRTALASATGQIELYVGEADNDVTIDGNSYDHILAWGAMVEANTSAPSSYIKSNSGSSTTRSADSCSVADFGYTGGPVSITTEVTAAASADGTQRVFTLFEGSDLVSTYFSGGGDIKTFIDVGGSTQVDASILANAVSGTDYNVGISFNTNDYRGAYNGTLGAADTSCTLPTFSSPTLQIGAQSGGSNPLSGHIKRLALYNVALSDVELQSLTTS